MEPDMNQSALPALCRSNCGFYGSPVTDGLCSKCFKDTLKRKQDPGRLSPTTSSVSRADASTTMTHESPAPTTSNCSSGVDPVDVPSMIQNALNEKRAAAASLIEAEAKKSASSDVEESSTSSGADDDAAAAKEELEKQAAAKKSNRCIECRKKVGFTGFECRCGGLYCAIHRYSDMHRCTFDYKALGQEEIRKNNPVVKNEKIQKL